MTEVLFVRSDELTDEIASAIALITFNSLADTPTSYAGQGEKFVKVKAAEDGLEFVSGGSGYLPEGSPVSGNIAVFGTDPDAQLEDGGVAIAGLQPIDADLTALAALGTTGMLARTGAATYALRTLTAPAAGFTITDGNGVAGNPTFVLADDLAALEALSGTDTIYRRSGANTWSAVTFASTITFSGGQISGTAASDTQSGVSELAIASEINTGTDATRAITPDALAGSNLGTFVIEVMVFNDSANTTTGDGAGDVFIPIPIEMNGMNLVSVGAQVQTAGTTNTLDVQIARIRSGTPADMLSTKITIDSTEIDSSTAATPAVINGSNDDVNTGDQLRIDVDAAHTTPAKGLVVRMGFRLP